jgi:CheY-like chemotaxis protein
VRILLVDDDPLVLKIYKDGLSRLGLQVETAEDGMAAVKTLRAARPDVLVLDLMLPRFSGVDVLKFVRSEPALAGLPVIMLSNSFMSEMVSEAVGVGVEKALLKSQCTPTVLVRIILDLVMGRDSAEDRVALPPALAPASPSTAPPAIPAPAGSARPGQIARDSGEFMAKARADFLGSAEVTCAALRSHSQAFSQESDPAARKQFLEIFCRKVHFIAAIAGMAEFHQIAQMAGAFEALLFELMDKPAFVGPSVLRTIAFTIDFLAVLFDHARDATGAAPHVPQALVVDDDPLSNRVIVAALRRAEVKAQSVEDPLAALQWLEKRPFDLILLDIEMPGMDGFEVCKRLRLLPGYQKTPVIYVTAHADFDSRARSILSGGNDLISKPVFPIELAVKAVAHMLRSQLAP